MFTTFSNAFKIASNLNNIKDVVSTVYTVIVKTSNVLSFINEQADGTKFSKTVTQYLPGISSILTKIKDIIVKYGKFVGFDASTVVVAQSSDPQKDLKDALASLDALLK